MTNLEEEGIPVVDVRKTDAHEGPVAIELLRSLNVVSRCVSHFSKQLLEKETSSQSVKSAACEAVTTATPAEPVNLPPESSAALHSPNATETHPESQALLLSHSPTYLRAGISSHPVVPARRAHSLPWASPVGTILHAALIPTPTGEENHLLSIQPLLLHQRAQLGELRRRVLGRVG